MRPRYAKKGEINFAFVDRFTLVHLGIGIVYGVVGFKIWLVLALAFTWELLENPLKANFPGLFPHATADSLQNMVGDVLAVSAGWALAHLAIAVSTAA